MAQKNKIPSNSTGLRYAEEASLKVLPGSPVWRPLEPNTYADFGGEITTLPRNPINPSRQRKKGVTVDLDASAAFNTDLTQENLQDLLQGFFVADLRTKKELPVAIVDTGGTGDDYEPASGGDAYVPFDLLFAKGFDDAENNGLKVVTGTPVASSVPVTTPLTPATAQTGTISHVGFEFASGDVDIDATGTLPALVSTVKDLTTLGLTIGEWVFIGGDLAAQQFVSALNNGFARVRSIATNRIEFDKTDSTMIDETGTGLTIRLFFGRVLKNESDPTLQVRRTYQLERTLGAPDDALPTEIQAEYVVGAVPGELTMNVVTADKLNLDLLFTGVDSEQIDGPTALKTGTRPAIVEADAFNTSSDFSRIKMALVVPGDAAPTPLFAFLQELTLTLSNTLSADKAVGVLGACDVTAGSFIVGGSLTAYFANVAAIAAVRDNADVTLDFSIVKSNAGMTFDVPLITLNDGRPTVEQDAAMTIPLGQEAATGASIDIGLDHTLLMVFWDFLPDLADV